MRNLTRSSLLMSLILGLLFLLGSAPFLSIFCHGFWGHLSAALRVWSEPILLYFWDGWIWEGDCPFQ